MKNRLRLLLAAVAVCAAALVPGASAQPGKVYFNGDFETGNLGQWRHVDRGGGIDRPGSGIVQVVANPAARGRYATELTVTPTAHASTAASSDSVYLWNDGGQPYLAAGGEVWEHLRVDFPASTY